LAVQVELGTIGDLPAAVVAALTGAVSEALTNVRKHAEIGTATVRARPLESGTGVVVTVEDRGRGFAMPARGGFGTSESIVRRLSDAGGTATIDSEFGRGTLVTLEWPR